MCFLIQLKPEVDTLDIFFIDFAIDHRFQCKKYFFIQDKMPITAEFKFQEQNIFWGTVATL